MYYRIVGSRAHQGIKKEHEVVAYIKDVGAMEAMIVYNGIRGLKPSKVFCPTKRMKRSNNAQQGEFLPTLRLLSDQEAQELNLEKVLKVNGQYLISE